MSVMKIHSNIKEYTVSFVENTDFLLRLEERFPQRCYMVDENVWRLHADGCLRELDRGDLVIQSVNEEQKSLISVQRLYDRLMQRSAKRNLALISIGGGIIQDITGFVASTLYRGINWVYVPTTLLAQADSCIGSKTSLNYKGSKNLIGTFYPPSEIFIYTSFLNTLADIDYFSGLGEVVKLHILGGALKIKECIAFLPAMLRRDPTVLLHGVQNSLAIKHTYITEDEFDLGRRNLLNYGHCFGHALEATSDFEIPHGQAVVLGMILANRVARRRGVLSESFERDLLEELLLPSLKVRPNPNHLEASAVVEAMKKDKKRTGDDLALIMLKDEYRLESVRNLTATEAADALGQVEGILSSSPAR
ncbi:MAG: 3-dehydroquinate synthase [Chloroflexota bacterium]|nr:3-dehydroquinate synthase [Chloroflexota bacterium]